MSARKHENRQSAGNGTSEVSHIIIADRMWSTLRFRAQFSQHKLFHNTFKYMYMTMKRPPGSLLLLCSFFFFISPGPETSVNKNVNINHSDSDRPAICDDVFYKPDADFYWGAHKQV